LWVAVLAGRVRSEVVDQGKKIYRRGVDQTGTFVNGSRNVGALDSGWSKDPACR
jgi:hypothetical protein